MPASRTRQNRVAGSRSKTGAHQLIPLQLLLATQAAYGLRIGIGRDAARRLNGWFHSIPQKREYWMHQKRCIQFKWNECTTLNRRSNERNRSGTCRRTRSGFDRSTQPKASSLARCAAFTTALIKVTRSFPSSNSMIASIVQPAGVVTASLSSAG